MQQYKRPEAIKRMNELAGSRKPFLFIIEFILKDTKNHITLYSRSKQADNEFYRVRGYMSCNRVAVSSVGTK